jgi:hypothetical protein
MRSCTPSVILADVSAQCLLSYDASLNPLNAVADLVKLFEDAFKQQPDNDELGRQAFFANVRAGNWKAAQLVRFSRHIAHRVQQQLYANDSSFPVPSRRVALLSS